MKKSLLLSALALAAFTAYADDPTFNFFDPADCDEEGWLWLDTPEKIAKYIGEGKKIQLVNTTTEMPDPDFPGETYIPETIADATVEGYNTEGVKGGEGSKTGGIILPETLEHSQLWGVPGGGILIQMPDCAQFDVYMSQELPGVYTWIAAARGYVDSLDPTSWFNAIWNEDDENWDPNVEVGPLKGVTYAGYDMDIQKLWKDLSFGDGTGPDADNLSIYGPKGEARTAGFYNYSFCPMIVQGIRIYTYTDVSLSDTSVEGIAADVDLKVNGKVVTVAAPAEINVYDVAGAKVASVYGTTLDCSALNGLYIVKAGNKSLKVNF